MAGRASRVSLLHVTDEEPGIRRRRPEKASLLRFTGPEGDRRGNPRPHPDDRHSAGVDRCLDLPDPDGHIQATGRDLRGRKQYRYHERWSLCRDEVKYGSLVAFAAALPKLRTQVDADLRRRSLSFERVAAAVVWLLDNTMIRVGNPAYARDNQSFGLTTLRRRHVEVEGSARCGSPSRESRARNGG